MRQRRMNGSLTQQFMVLSALAWKILCYNLHLQHCSRLLSTLLCRRTMQISLIRPFLASLHLCLLPLVLDVIPNDMRVTHTLPSLLIRLLILLPNLPRMIFSTSIITHRRLSIWPQLGWHRPRSRWHRLVLPGWLLSHRRPWGYRHC